MTPDSFLADVVKANIEHALNEPHDIRAIVNAILSLDALTGIIHANGGSNGRAEIAAYARDDEYREALSKVSPSYRVLRDTAASLKHGELTDRRSGKRLPRLLHGPDAMRSNPNGLGLFRVGDRLGSGVVVIEFNPGPGYVRASDVIGDSYRMLRRIVEGGPARTDEHDTPVLRTETTE